MTCAVQTYRNVGGRGTVAQVVDGTAVVVPAASVQVRHRVAQVSGEVVTQADASSVGNGERTGQREDLVHCTYDAAFQDPSVDTMTVEGTVTAVMAPRQ